MKRLIFVAFLSFGMLAQEPPKDPLNAIRADLAIAQRDYERLNSQCQVQVQSSDQARRLVALLKTATEACKNAGDQILDTDSLRCVQKAKEIKQ